MHGRRPIVFLLLLAPLLGGCAALYDDCAVRWRNRCEARSAWHRNRGNYCNVPYLHDFAKGFKDGYVDVANGADGSPPVLPPRCYWGARDADFQGKAKIAAWYDGYAHGAMVAQGEGARERSAIPVTVLPDQIDPHALATTHGQIVSPGAGVIGEAPSPLPPPPVLAPLPAPPPAPPAEEADQGLEPLRLPPDPYPSAAHRSPAAAPPGGGPPTGIVPAQPAPLPTLETLLPVGATRAEAGRRGGWRPVRQAHAAAWPRASAAGG